MSTNPERILDAEKVRSNEVSEDADIITPDEIEEKTADAEFDDAMVFETSGTSGDPKRIPYSYSELDRQRSHEAKAFRIGGMDEDDVVMTLGAPLNSISGWASRSGSRQLGAEVLNRSFDDYQKVIDWHENQEVTTIFATPLVARSIGNEIEEEYGVLPREIFPNMERGFMFGDLLPQHLEETLETQWGFDDLRSLYGTVEADVIAIEECSSGKLVPMLDKHVLEIRPYNEEGDLSDEIIDIRDIDEVTEGSILISDIERDKMDLTRYEIGDAVRVYPAEAVDPFEDHLYDRFTKSLDSICANLSGERVDIELPRLEVLGRADNTINMGGAPLYENTIHKAVVETYGDEFEDWQAYVSRPGKRMDVGETTHKPAIDIFVSGEDLQNRQHEFLENLFERSPPVKEAYNDVGDGIIEYIDLHYDKSLEDFQLIKGENIERDIKSERIIFDSTY